MKKITKILICIFAVVLFIGCTPVTTSADNSNICVIDTYHISSDYAYVTFYDKDTGVCYIAIGEGVTPLYNADGSLKIYKESKDEY